MDLSEVNEEMMSQLEQAVKDIMSVFITTKS